jgi:hypothetical protein
MRRLPPLALALLATGCGGSATPAIPVAIGPTPAYRPPSLSRAVAAARPVGSMRCEPRALPRFGVYVELFADRRVVLIPAGIGVAPPRVRRGAYVPAGRCSYPLRTREPTGVIEVARSTRARLGDLFDLWGQPLSTVRLAGFRADRDDPVRVYVDGRRLDGDPRAAALTRHATIVVELGPYLPPHRSYRFPPGL